MDIKRLSVGSLEFDEIKANLKTFLSAQDTFSDYNFEGSNMSVLLDILAYNTYYNTIYNNMALSEAYLETASKRQSVVSAARNLGYVPRSAVCATTKISFTISDIDDPAAAIVLPRNTAFQGVLDGVRYTFYTREDVTSTWDSDNEYYSFEDVVLIEGRFVQESYVWDGNPIVMRNQNIDKSTLVVRVQESSATTDYDIFVNAESLETVTETTNCYYINETYHQYYEMRFGDGVAGTALDEGQVVNLYYYISNGDAANGIRSITYDGSYLMGGTLSAITLDDVVRDGSYPEDIESIRFNAPNFYAAQNRAVTTKDYEAILLNKIPNIESITVWGGENSVPPVYGKVFISVKTTGGRTLTLLEKEDIIENIINKYKSVSITPEFVDPEYINVQLDVVVYYDPTLTSRTANDIKTLAYDALVEYNDNQLQKFDKMLRFADVAHLVENVDPSITSVTPRTKIHRTVTPVYFVDHNYSINIGNPLAAGSITSTVFYKSNYEYACYLQDDGAGNIYHYTTIDGIKTNVGLIGTVDYNNGIIYLTDLNIVKIETAEFRITANVNSADIVSLNRQIVQLDESLLKVSMIVDNYSSGRVVADNSFEFTALRI